MDDLYIDGIWCEPAAGGHREIRCGTPAAERGALLLRAAEQGGVKHWFRAGRG